MKETKMSRYALPLAALLALASCDGAAIIKAGTPDPDLTTELPPGTTNPTASRGIKRYEAETTDGSGYAQDFTYNAAADTFTVDNLAFDGDNTYTRLTALGALNPGPFRVYEGPASTPDSVTGAAIPQFLHRAILGTSTSGEVEFAIVRTGSYVNYGFGGFVYSRKGKVTLPLPSTGQARFEGDYLALRDFTGRSGIEYATGDMTVDIDFADFNDGRAVKGSVSNRKVYDVNGTDITAQVVAGMQDTFDNPAISVLPTLVFAVGPGHVDNAGEIAGDLASHVRNGDGQDELYESGNYYALLSGEGVDEVVGIIVVTAEDARYKNVTVRETGGFILTRP